MTAGRTTATAVALVGTVLLASACERDAAAETQAATQASRTARVDAALADSTHAPTDAVARWVLPNVLREISGLTLLADGRLLAHGDERGNIWQVDYRSGTLLNEFSVGSPAVRGDFEAIASAGERLFLMTSDALLYEFREGAKGAHVPFVKHDTHLGANCEFEGATYDSTSDALLLVCKTIHKPELGDGILIYRWPLRTQADTLPPITIPLAAVVGGHSWTALHPSDITIDPTTGEYVLIASKERALIVLKRDGTLVRALSLPATHTQPEGIAITPGHALIISDEAGTRAASITVYRWPWQLEASHPGSF